MRFYENDEKIGPALAVAMLTITHCYINMLATIALAVNYIPARQFGYKHLCLK